MTRRIARRPWRALTAGLLLALALTGCGGSDGQSGGDGDGGAAGAKAYAAQVSAISTRTGDQLAKLAGTADYTKADAAARSTRAYAAAIGKAADELRRAKAPASVAALQRQLVVLYRDTARSLDALAAKFGAAQDPVALAARAQDLSSAVQRYSSREQQLRDAISRALVDATTPAAR